MKARPAFVPTIFMVAICAVLAACTVETVEDRGGMTGARADLPRRPAQAPAGQSRVDPSVISQTQATRVDDVRSLDIRLGVRPLGAVGSDDLTLPVVRRDGRRMAVQYGFTPDWESVLALPGASATITTRIEILAIGDDTAEPRPLASVDEPVLLGRSSNDRGFLVESPRPNGARWIGLADWETGRIDWLVDDDARVAAFGSLGPEGMLAWSSRPIDAERFDLMVRPGIAAAPWRLASGFRSWLMPTWSGVGFGLFAVVLDGDRLELTHFDASSENQVFRTIRRLEVATGGATIDTAYQSMSSVISNGATATNDQIYFVHPARLRAAVWRPDEGLVLFEPGSYAAAGDPSNPDFALVSTRNGLVRQSIVRSRDRYELMRAQLVLRSSDPATSRAIAIEPAAGQQRQGVVELYFLPLDD